MDRGWRQRRERTCREGSGSPHEKAASKPGPGRPAAVSATNIDRPVAARSPAPAGGWQNSRGPSCWSGAPPMRGAAGLGPSCRLSSAAPMGGHATIQCVILPHKRHVDTHVVHSKIEDASALTGCWVGVVVAGCRRPEVEGVE